jgi:hypothetical protein
MSRKTPKDFINDYNERVDEPQRDDKPSRWYGGKRRHIPERPRGLYLAYINDLIERNQAKR